MKEQFREPWEKLKGKLVLIQGKRKLINVAIYAFWARWKDLCPLAIRMNRLTWVILAPEESQKSLCLTPLSSPACLGLCLQPHMAGRGQALGNLRRREDGRCEQNSSPDFNVCIVTAQRKCHKSLHRTSMVGWSLLKMTRATLLKPRLLEAASAWLSPPCGSQRTQVS